MRVIAPGDKRRQVASGVYIRGEERIGEVIREENSDNESESDRT